MKKRDHARYYERRLLSSRSDKTCGVTVQDRSMERLKLEVDLACDYFWEKRGTTDPGAGGFRLFHLNFGRAA